MFKKLAPEIKITVIYIALGLIWIFSSDTLTHALFDDNMHFILTIQTMKGGFFVLITGIALYLLIHYENKKYNKNAKILEKTNAELLKNTEEKKALIKRMITENAEKKRINAALRISEKKYRTLFETSREGYVLMDTNGKFLDCNTRFTNMIGYSLDELKEKTFWDITPDEWHDIEKDIMNYHRFREKGFLAPYEKPYLRKNDTILPVEASMHLLYNEFGKPDRMWQVVRDISKEKKAKEDLLKSEQRFKKYIEASPTPIFINDKDGYFTYVNNSACDLLGYPANELIGKHISKLQAYSNIQGLFTQLKQQGKIKEEIGLRKKNAALTTVLVQAVELDDNTYIAFCTDISEIKKTEAALKENVQKFRLLFEDAGVHIYTYDLNAKLTMINKKCAQFMKGKPYEFIGKSVFDILPEELAQKNKKRIDEVANKGITIQYEHKFRIWGREFCFFTVAQPIRNIQNEISAIQFISSDITERKIAEQEINKQKEKLTYYLDVLGVVFLVLDNKANILLINRKGCDILGCSSKEELIGKNWFDIAIEVKDRNKVQQVFKKFIAGEIEPYTYFENSIKNASGKQQIIRWHNALLKDKSGKVCGVISSGEDITQNRFAQKALKESETRYQSLLEAITDSVYVIDTNGEVIIVNSATEKEWNTNRNNLIGKRICDLFPDFKHTDYHTVFSTVLNNDKSEIIVRNYNLNNKACGWFEVKAFPVQEGILCISTDITQRKKIEEEIRENEHRLRNVIENMPVMMNALDSNGNFIVWNKECEQVTGYAASEIIGNPNAYKLLYPNERYRQKLFRFFEKQKGDIRNSIWKLVAKNQTIRVIEWSNISKSIPVKGWSNWAVGIDITARVVAERKRRRAEKELDRSRKLLHFAIEQMPIPAIIVDALKMRILIINSEAKKIMAKPIEDKQKINAYDFISYWQTFHPDRTSLTKHDNPLVRSIKNGEIIRRNELIIKKNEQENWVSLTAVPLYDEQNRIIAGIVVFPNITELKNKTVELEKHQDRLEELVKQRTEEVEQINEELQAANEELQQTNTQLTERQEIIELQSTRMKSANQILHKQTLKLQNTINELKATQEQLIQAEKMASLGQLTAGIAHEINNPINFINSGISGLKLLIDDLLSVIDLYEDIGKINVAVKLKQIEAQKKKIKYSEAISGIHKLTRNIENGISRTIDIVKGLHTFSRPDTEEFILHDIHQIIDSSLVLLHNQYKNRITIAKNYKAHSRIFCYPGKMNQVFMNLLSNAIQAIKKKGKIEIETKDLKQQASIQIEIKDNGGGMTMDVQKHIFEPFYTTKNVGKGIGLGLSITYSIVQQHKGTIQVRSKPNKGTEFILRLPFNPK